ncbi:hypothetical protein H0G86_009431 [Trichoderma simmonsii]|uniref:Uncharacterized protein n=1 Tax=Trichoderma simmonsii TaxID=1491479 RepID=A0A8G0LHJ7_9HYPO|nr:hypothetical protein H0G86_009431 [Trichoderma simmonsii]
MPQGTQSAAFSMTEAMRVALGPIPDLDLSQTWTYPRAQSGTLAVGSYGRGEVSRPWRATWMIYSESLRVWKHSGISSRTTFSLDYCGPF